MKKLLFAVSVLFALQQGVAYGHVSSWGEKCKFTAECGDHRLECVEVGKDGSKICMCDRFHRWNGTDIGCVQKYNSSEIALMFTEKYKVAERIQREADFVFVAQLLAGSIVMLSVALSTLTVIGGCLYVRHNDKKLADVVRRFESMKKARNPGPSPVCVCKDIEKQKAQKV